MKEKIKSLLSTVGLLDIARSIYLLKNKTLWHVIFKSQKKQDRWVLFDVLPFKRNGFFIELAAADGVTHSNTWVMEKLFNWKGICIEPNPYFFEKLQKNRNCFLDSSIINDKEEVLKFRIDNGQLGGIVADDTDNNVNVRAEELENAEIIEKHSITLTQLLDKYNAPKEIDYFSLDVEGAEERILRGFDFKKYVFKCITIERANANVNKMMFENGYMFVKNYRYDTFYIHSSIKELVNIEFENFEQVPTKDW